MFGNNYLASQQLVPQLSYMENINQIYKNLTKVTNKKLREIIFFKSCKPQNPRTASQQVLVCNSKHAQRAGAIHSVAL